MDNKKIINEIIETSNDKIKSCNMEITYQKGIIQGVDYMTYKIVNILNNNKVEKSEG